MIAKVIKNRTSDPNPPCDIASELIAEYILNNYDGDTIQIFLSKCHEDRQTELKQIIQNEIINHWSTLSQAQYITDLLEKIIRQRFTFRYALSGSTGTNFKLNFISNFFGILATWFIYQ